VAGPALIASAWLAASHWAGEPSHSAALDKADTPGSQAADGLAGTHLSQQTGAGPITGDVTGHSQSRAAAHAGSTSLHAVERRMPAQAQPVPAQPVYRNPLRGVTGLMPERVDMGVDFAGSGPVFALGDAVVTNAEGNSGGWPGGGWITYRLTDGPDAGKVVYVAEDVTPAVQVGQHVSSSTVVANMFAGGDGIETGWAMPDSASAESQLPEAGGISGGGPFPTMIGLNFEELLQTLGVPASNNSGQAGFGILPAGYPTSWQ
jgi:hypothetical protein